MSAILNLEEMKATKQILEKAIEKQEEEQAHRNRYREVLNPTRQDLKLMTAKEISKRYGVGENRIRELIQANRQNSMNFPCIRMGRKTLIPQHMFEEWLIKACESGLRL